MKKCLHCGMEPLADHTNFCPGCGSPIITPHTLTDAEPKKPGMLLSLLLAYLYTFLFATAAEIVSNIYVYVMILINGKENIETLITPDSTNLATIIIYLTLFAITAVIFAVTRTSPKKTAGLSKAPFISIPLAALFGYSANLIYSFVLTLIPWSEKLLNDQEAYYGDVGTDGSSLILTILATALFTGIAEELVFRGLVITRLRKSFGRAATVVISALLFGIAHPTLISFTYSFVLGLFLGIIFLRYNSVLPCIAVHIFFNLAACIGYPESPILLLGLLFICAAFNILALYLLLKNGGTDEDTAASKTLESSVQ